MNARLALACTGAGLVLMLAAASSATAEATPPTITAQALAIQLSEQIGGTLLDVRSREEFAAGHIAGALNIPVQELEQRLDEVPAAQPVVIYCRSGRRATQAAGLLRGRGLQVTELEGSFLAWQAARLPETVAAPAASSLPPAP